MAFFNSDIDKEYFLQHYWQKRPRVFRNAYQQLPAFDYETLVEMAADDRVESRLIQGADHDWQLDHGPFVASDLVDMPTTDWTLLVQDVDKFNAELARMLVDFDFVPDWRLDDIMVSYAAPGGSVGPHTDAYDVFLLQAAGHRRWQLSNTPVTQPKWLADCDLRILDNFHAEQSFVLGPGDMLYLPPHYAHHGVAEDFCMTYSVGFRAPSGQELLDAVLIKLLETGQGEQRFRDPVGVSVTNTAEITATAINGFRGLLADTLAYAEPQLPEIIGELVTTPKPSLEDAIDDTLPLEPVEHDDLDDYFQQGGELTRNRLLRIAWVVDEHKLQVFYAGQSVTLAETEHAAVERISEQDVLTAEDWAYIGLSVDMTDLLITLLNEGVWQMA